MKSNKEITMIGIAHSCDFENKTITFEVEEGLILMAGKYKIERIIDNNNQDEN